MASNVFITPQLVTREVLPFLSNERVFSRNINHQWDKHFDANGAPKSGARLEIRLPSRFTSRTGNAMQVQGISDDITAIVMAEPIGIDLDISTIDWTLNIDDFRQRYGQPMASQIANEIDKTFLQQALLSYFTVGTPGTTPGTASGESALRVWMRAKTALANVGVKDDGNIHALGNPAAIGETMIGLSTLYNPQNTISEQYRKGVIVGALNVIFNMTQNLPVITCGSRAGTVTVQATSTQGDTTLAVTGMTGTLNYGEVFEVGDATYPINFVNYQTRAAIPNPRTGAYGTMQFVCRETVTSSGAGTTTTIKVSPSIIGPVSGVVQQYQVLDSLPQASATVSFIGTANYTYPINLVYHRDAFAAAFAKLWNPPGEAYQEVYDGVGMRYWRQGDIQNNAAYDRMDVLAACTLALSERVVRVMG